MTLARPRRSTAVVGTVLLAALALGACSASGGASSGAAVGAAAPANPGANAGANPGANPGLDPAAPDAATDGQAQAQSGSAQSKAGGSAAAGGSTASKPASSSADLVGADKVVRNAALTVQTEDVEAAAAESRRIAVTAGGSVLSENSTAVPRSNTGAVDKTGSRSTLTLAVPADQLDSVLDGIGKLGTVAARTSSATDVTRQYVDTQSRITTMKAGLDQVRALLAKTTDLNQVISLEQDISRRQADLDSLQAQLNALDKKVAMSTITLTLTTAAPVVVPEEQEAGFLGGLKAGWNGFLRMGGVILTVLGAVLPFLLLAALVVAPVVWWRRRRQAAQATREDRAPRGPAGGTGSGGGNGGGGTNGDGGGDGGPHGGNGGGHGGPAGSEGGDDPDGDPEPSTEREPEPAGAR